MAVTYMTEEGLRKLKEELVEMESVLRPEISRQIAEARDKGDLSEMPNMMLPKMHRGCWKRKLHN